MATNIQYLAPGDVATPASGEVTYFFNTANNNILSYKDDTGTVYVFTGSPESIQTLLIGVANTYVSDISCALKRGAITAAEFTTIMAAGFTISSGDGTTTYTVTVA